MSVNTNFLKAAGLFTHPNELSSVPDSSTEVCENIIIDRDGAFEQRRGFEKYINGYTGEERTKQIIAYKGILLRHRDNLLEYEVRPESATGYFRIVDNSALVPETDTVELNGYVLYAVSVAPTLVDFEIAGTDADTAQNLATTINNHPVLSIRFVATASAEFVFVTAKEPGTDSNTVTLSSSNLVAIDVSAPTMESGVDGEFISFLQSVEEPTSDARVKAIESNGNLYVTTSTGIAKVGVAESTDITALSLKPAGIERALSITGEPVILRNFQQFICSSSTVDPTEDTITLTAHGFVDGTGIYLVGSDIPGGTTADTLYYVQVVTNDSFKLHSNNSLNALVDITSEGTGQVEVRLGTSQVGFMATNSAVNYRYLLGENDPNNNLLLGWPSQTFTVTYNGTEQLIRDYNDLLRYLDSNGATSNTDELGFSDYYSELSIPDNSFAADVNAAIQKLAEKLDRDLTPTVGFAAIDPANIDPATDRITITAHGLSNNQIIQFSAVTTTTLQPFTNYFVTVVDANTIEVSLERGGAKADIASASSSLNWRRAGGYSLTSDPVVGGIKLARIYNNNLELIMGTATQGSFPSGYAQVGESVYVSGLTGVLSETNGVRQVTSCATPISFTTAEVNAATDRVTIQGSNLVSGTRLRFTSTTTLPGGLNANSEYVVLNPTLNDFQVALVATPTVVVDITNVGAGVHSVHLAVLSLSMSGSNTSTVSAGLGSAFIGKTFTTVTNLTKPTEPEFTGQQYQQHRNWLEEIVFRLEAEPEFKIAPPSASSRFRVPTTSANVRLTVNLPAGIDPTTDFVRIYRSDVFQATDAALFSAIVPSEELRLAYESSVTPEQFNEKILRYIDIASDSFVSQQVVLYTNQFSGEGDTQANAKPPVAADITSFRNSIFYANTSQVHSKLINVVGVATLNTGDTFTIANGVQAVDVDNVFKFVEAVRQGTQFKFVNGTVSDSDYITLSSANDEQRIVFWFGTTEPVVAGATAYEKVGVAGSFTAAQLAVAFENSINKFAKFFTAFSLEDTLTIENKDIGAAAIPVVVGVPVAVGFPEVEMGSRASTNPADNEVNLFKSDNLSPSQQIDFTTKDLVRAISLNPRANAKYYAYYLSNTATSPGIFQVVERGLNEAGSFRLLVSKKSTDVAAFSPDLNAQFFVDTSGPVSVSYTSNTATVTQPLHGLQTGNRILVAGNSTITDDFVATSVVRIDANTFTFDVNTGTSGSFFYKRFSLAEKSDNEAFPNRIYFSKFQQPEAVPLVNFIDIGPRSKAIKRIIALRDGLFIFKEEAIYRLTGSFGNFQVSLFDSSAVITSADSAAVLNNQIYVLTTQGVATVTDTGVSIISRPVEDKVIRIAQFPRFARATFGVGYESARSYHLWTVKEPGDTSATQCLRYNTFTQTWTEWTNPASCGLVDPANDRLVIGSGVDNFVEKERKTFTRTDYADRNLDSAISPQIATKTVAVANIDEIAIGDVVMQEQFVTIDRWHRFLRKLDEDTGVVNPGPQDPNYFFNKYSVLPAQDLAQALIDCIIELNNILDLDVSTVVPTSPAQLRDRYNELMLSINIDGVSPNSLFQDYEYITDSIFVEYPVMGIDQLQNTVTFGAIPSFVAGPLIVSKAIKTKVQYNPVFFQDPSGMKQVYQGTYMFEYLNFTQAFGAYASDLSPDYEEIDFNGLGNGSFGNGQYGTNFYGGNQAAIPLRTYIPRNKQYCRFIKMQFRHAVAREGFKLFGVSLTVSAMAKNYR